MDGKVKVIMGGGYLDNYIIYVRNNHPLVSIFVPTDYNPINGAERVGTLFILAVAAYALTAAFDSDHFGFSFATSMIVLIVDFFLYYLSTREDRAIVDRQQDETKGEWCEEECAMRQENVEYLVRTRNERAVVARGSWSVCMGNYCMYFLVFACFIVFCVAAFGSSGSELKTYWIVPWLLSFAYWFGTGFLTFTIKYCIQEDMDFTEDDGDDMEGFGSPEELSVDDAKQIITDWASNQCCYGDAIDDLDIVAIEGKLTKKMTFDSWSEYRSSGTGEEPYRGQEIGDYCPPGNWEMEPEGWPEAFTESSTETHKPNSDQRITCPKCNGEGVIRRESTDDEGNTTHHEFTCDRCDGAGELHTWETLCVSWGLRHLSNCLDCSSCPLFIVNMSQGKEAEKDEAYRPCCNGSGEDPAIPTPSLAERTGDEFFKETLEDFISNKHSEIEHHHNARVDAQRYQIEWVPIWEVKYNSDEVVKEIFILGVDKDIYWPAREYGKKCCYCCNCFDCNVCGKRSW